MCDLPRRVDILAEHVQRFKVCASAIVMVTQDPISRLARYKNCFIVNEPYPTLKLSIVKYIFISEKIVDNRTNRSGRKPHPHFSRIRARISPLPTPLNRRNHNKFTIILGLRGTVNRKIIYGKVIEESLPRFEILATARPKPPIQLSKNKGPRTPKGPL